MELTLQRVVKIEVSEIYYNGCIFYRVITITMKDGAQAKVTCFADTDEDKEPTEALKVVV